MAKGEKIKSKKITPKAVVTLDEKPLMSRDCVYRKEGDEIHIVSITDSTNLFAISGLSKEIWLQLDGKTKVSKLISWTVKKMNISETQAKKLVLEFLADLKKNKLI